MVEGKFRTKEEINKLDRCLGCVMGSFIGDALGCPIEFSTKKMSPSFISQLLNWEIKDELHGTIAGQVTDDSELGICLTHALLRGNGAMNTAEIARFYGKWFKESKPFDVGGTIRNSFIVADPVNPDAMTVQKRSMKALGSQSNGALMRITPLCVFLHRVEEFPGIMLAIQEETYFSHSNPQVHEASKAYCLAILTLINTGDRLKAFQAAKDFAKTASGEFKGWFARIESGEQIDCHEQMGWVRIAFHYALSYLNSKFTYKEVMMDILGRGGDTDTNAAIVGGMIGAATGYLALPKELKEKILSVDPKADGGVPRPAWLVPKYINLPKMITLLFDIAPKQLIIDKEPNLLPLSLP